jgi:hypothetical protein
MSSEAGYVQRLEEQAAELFLMQSQCVQFRDKYQMALQLLVENCGADAGHWNVVTAARLMDKQNAGAKGIT